MKSATAFRHTYIPTRQEAKKKLVSSFYIIYSMTGSFMYVCDRVIKAISHSKRYYLRKLNAIHFVQQVPINVQNVTIALAISQAVTIMGPQNKNPIRRSYSDRFVVNLVHSVRLTRTKHYQLQIEVYKITTNGINE